MRSREQEPESGHRETILDESLPRTTSCGQVARAHVAHHLLGWVSPRELDDAKLIASELANNAFMHGEGVIRLRVIDGDDHVRIEISDEGRDALVEIRNVDPWAAGGRGLSIVKALARQWGTSTDGATRVWADLAIAAP